MKATEMKRRREIVQEMTNHPKIQEAIEAFTNIDGYKPIVMIGNAGWYTYKQDGRKIATIEDYLERINNKKEPSKIMTEKHYISTGYYHPEWLNKPRDKTFKLSDIERLDPESQVSNIVYTSAFLADIDFHITNPRDIKELGTAIYEAVNSFLNRNNIRDYVIAINSGHGIQIRFHPSLFKLYGDSAQKQLQLEKIKNGLHNLLDLLGGEIVSAASKVGYEYGTADEGGDYQVDALDSMRQSAMPLLGIHKLGYINIPLTDKFEALYIDKFDVNEYADRYAQTVIDFYNKDFSKCGYMDSLIAAAPSPQDMEQYEKLQERIESVQLESDEEPVTIEDIEEFRAMDSFIETLFSYESPPDGKLRMQRLMAAFLYSLGYKPSTAYRLVIEWIEKYWKVTEIPADVKANLNYASKTRFPLSKKLKQTRGAQYPAYKVGDLIDKGYLKKPDSANIPYTILVQLDPKNKSFGDREYEYDNDLKRVKVGNWRKDELVFSPLFEVKPVKLQHYNNPFSSAEDQYILVSEQMFNNGTRIVRSPKTTSEGIPNYLVRGGFLSGDQKTALEYFAHFQRDPQYVEEIEDIDISGVAINTLTNELQLLNINMPAEVHKNDVCNALCSLEELLGVRKIRDQERADKICDKLKLKRIDRWLYPEHSRHFGIVFKLISLGLFDYARRQIMTNHILLEGCEGLKVGESAFPYIVMVGGGAIGKNLIFTAGASCYYENDFINTKLLFDADSAKNVSRLRQRIGETGTMPFHLEEGSTIFTRDDNKIEYIDFLKSMAFNSTPSVTNTQAQIPEFWDRYRKPVISTNSPRVTPVFKMAGIDRRSIVFEFVDINITGQSHVRTHEAVFFEYWTDLHRIFKPIGDFILKRIFGDTRLLYKPFNLLVEDLYEEMYQFAGLEYPEILKGLTPEELQLISTSPVDKVRRYLRNRIEGILGISKQTNLSVKMYDDGFDYSTEGDTYQDALKKRIQADQLQTMGIIYHSKTDKVIITKDLHEDILKSENSPIEERPSFEDFGQLIPNSSWERPYISSNKRVRGHVVKLNDFVEWIVVGNVEIEEE